jgi:hypothetical protein
MKDKTIREELQEAFDEHMDASQDTASAPTEEVVETAAPETDEAPIAFEAPAEEPAPDQKPEIAPPQAWTADAKKDWAAIPAHIQAEIIKRENDTHKMFTAREGELRLGREMKDVIDPYISSIKEAGTTPTALIHDLLGTVNTLRNGSEEQKIAVMRNIADGYGVDLNKVIGYQHNPINQMYQELQGLKQQLSPETIINMLQERESSAKIQSEVEAFAADPKNVHFEKVRPFMQAVLESGQAQDLREAYDMACYAVPEIRSTMLNSVKTDDAAKRRTEIAQKKSAAVSIKGSSSSVQGNASPPDRTLREELEANMASALGSKI